MSADFERKVMAAAKFRVEDAGETALQRAYAVFPQESRRWARIVGTSLASAFRKGGIDSFQVAVEMEGRPVRIQFRATRDRWLVELRAPGCRIPDGTESEGGWSLADVAADQPIAVECDGVTYWIASPMELGNDDSESGDTR